MANGETFERNTDAEKVATNSVIIPTTAEHPSIKWLQQKVNLVTIWLAQYQSSSSNDGETNE